jgi:hypothetical protein
MVVVGQSAQVQSRQVRKWGTLTRVPLLCIVTFAASRAVSAVRGNPAAPNSIEQQGISEMFKTLSAAAVIALGLASSAQANPLAASRAQVVQDASVIQVQARRATPSRRAQQPRRAAPARQQQQQQQQQPSNSGFIPG